jgi:hypothetical protein
MAGEALQLHATTKVVFGAATPAAGAVRAKVAIVDTPATTTHHLTGMSGGIIICRTSGLDGRMAAICPIDEDRERAEDRFPQSGETVLDAGRLSREHRARDHPVAFQIAKRLRQHAFRNVRYGTLGSAEAMRSV